MLSRRCGTTLAAGAGRARRCGLHWRVIEELTREGLARADVVVLAGLSNGASFAERLARHAQVPAAMIVLVAGSARAASRRTQPRPTSTAAVLVVAGTADRVARYEGGGARGLMGMLARRRAGQILLAATGRESVAVEAVATDWALANGLPETVAVERLAGELAVDRLVWTEPDVPPVMVYRVNGGGHGWPGGPQYAPRFLVGAIPRRPDATDLLLDFARPLLTGW
jgi:polyhydroxybutyrate depolymerase